MQVSCFVVDVVLSGYIEQLRQRKHQFSLSFAAVVAAAAAVAVCDDMKGTSNAATA